MSNDSGASHLAAAVGCPAVVLFGPGDPALSFPYEDGRRFVSLAAPIDHQRPCFDPACDSDHGFSRILPEQVLPVCLKVADEGRRGPREAR